MQLKSKPLGQEVTKLRWLDFHAALLYGLVAGVWILFSGRLLAYFVSDPTSFPRLILAKAGFGGRFSRPFLLYPA